MREDVVRESIKQAMVTAQEARKAGDEAGRARALETAWSQAVELRDAPLLAATCWRLAKARYDSGRAEGTFEALAPLIEQTVEERGVWGVRHAVGPFDHYAAGLRALAPLSRQHWDQLGYRDETLLKLWDAYVAHQEAQEDPYLTAWGHIQRAWQLACTGQREALEALTSRYARLSPNTFGHGPHRHPRAEDTPTSIYWVQLDLFRTQLRAATWAHDERAAWDALEFLEDAAEDTGLDRHADFWWLDAALRAAGRFGHTDVLQRYLAPYAALVADEPEHIPAVHRARARAWIAHLAGEAQARELAAAALQAAQVGSPGPEWLVECALLAAVTDASQADHYRRIAAQEAKRTGVVMRDLTGTLVG